MEIRIAPRQYGKMQELIKLYKATGKKIHCTTKKQVKTLKAAGVDAELLPDQESLKGRHIDVYG